jgi:hypothetical protein
MINIMHCPHCGKNISDAMVVSYSQTLIRSKSQGAAKPRSHAAMLKAARARWAKHWEKQGGRPANYKAYRKKMLAEWYQKSKKTPAA